MIDERKAETLAQVYEHLAADLIRFAAATVGPSEAEDVVSNVLVRTLESRSFDPNLNPRAFLYQAVVWEARSLRRSGWRRIRRERMAARFESEWMPEIAPELLEAIRSLSPQQRAAVFLTYWEDRAPEDVATLLAVSVGSVKQHLARARSRMREVLK